MDSTRRHGDDDESDSEDHEHGQENNNEREDSDNEEHVLYQELGRAQIDEALYSEDDSSEGEGRGFSPALIEGNPSAGVITLSLPLINVERMPFIEGLEPIDLNVPSFGRGMLMVGGNVMCTLYGYKTIHNSFAHEETENRLTFDAGMILEHKYLGTDFKEKKQTSVFIAGECVNLPILVSRVDDLVVLPGQIVPLILKKFEILAQNIMSSSLNALVLVSTDRDVHSIDWDAGNTRTPLVGHIGVIGHILGHTYSSSHYGRQLLLKLKTRERCVVRFQSHRYEANVEILDDNDMLRQVSHPLSHILTAMPPWILQMYDSKTLMNYLQSYSKILSKPSIVPPSDICSFTYWLISNIPIPGVTKRRLLAMPSNTMQLNWLRKYFEEADTKRLVRCKTCLTPLADLYEAISLSAEGPSSIFVNPAGYLSDVITFRYASGAANIAGQIASDFSWFPGYDWMFAMCNCDSHLGWAFLSKTTRDRPIAFWCFRKSSIATNIVLDAPRFKE